MALISQAIPSLINGVSQQAPSIRSRDQGSEQVNCLSKLVDGLGKRPPFKHLKKLGITTPGEALIDIIDDPDEQLIVVLTDGDLKVFDFAGDEKTVNFPDGKTYLDTTYNPAKQMKMQTIADYTFITNRAKAVKMSTTADAGETPAGVVWIKTAVIGQTYNIVLDDVNVATYTAPGQGNVTTDMIASGLIQQIQGTLTGYSVDQSGPLLKLWATNLAEFKLDVRDSWGNAAMAALKGTVQTTSKLPEKFFPDITVKVQGDTAKGEDSFYMKWDNTSGTTTGAWIETVKPGLKNNYDKSTMPHALIHELDGTFTFQQVEWEPRKVGDTESIKTPSFVGRRVKDIIFWRNRIGFLAGENVVLTRAGDFFNFWPESAAAVIDSDPVDVAASAQDVQTLRHAVPFNESLLLFSDKAQFTLNTGNQPVSPKTVSLDVTTTFRSSRDVTPVAVGNNVYFVVKRGKQSTIREYFVQEDSIANDAADVTAHVPNYIPGGVFSMTASTNEDVVFLISEREQNRIYVYKFYWNGDEKVQSSWSYWQVEESAQLVGVQFVDTKLYALFLRADDLYIETCDLQHGLTDSGFTFEVLLDRRFTATGSYDSVAKQTTWTMPYEVPTGEPVEVVVGGGYGSKKGTRLVTSRPSVTTVMAPGNWSTSDNYIGLSYSAEYEFSAQYVRDSEGVAVKTGTMQVLTLAVEYAETGYFRVTVNPGYEDDYTYAMTGDTLGSSALLGEPSISDGLFQVPVLAKNTDARIRLINDSHMPSNWLGAEWEAQVHSRARRNL